MKVQVLYYHLISIRTSCILYDIGNETTGCYQGLSLFTSQKHMFSLTKKEEGKLSQQKIFRDWIMFRIIVAPNPSETFFYKKFFFTFYNLIFFAIITAILVVFVFVEKPTKFSFKDLSSFIWLRTLYCLDGDNDATKSSRI